MTQFTPSICAINAQTTPEICIVNYAFLAEKYPFFKWTFMHIRNQRSKEEIDAEVKEKQRENGIMCEIES